jgi:DNA-binding CsgD family transcriptional regulator
MRDLIGRIYDAALAPELWPETLGSIADSIGACQGNMYAGRLDPLAGPSFVNSRFDPEVWKRLIQTHVDNPWTSIAARQLPVGQAVPSEALLPASKLVRTEFYAECLEPSDIRHGAGAMLLREPGFLSGLAFHQSWRKGPVGSAALAALQRLIPHFERASRIALRLEGIDGQRAAALEAIDRLELGVVLLDAKGLVVFANRAAQEMARAGDALSIVRGELLGSTAESTVALRKLARESIATGCGCGEVAGGTLQITRPAPRAPLTVEAAPLREHGLIPAANRPCAVFFIRDHDREVVTAGVRIQRRYRLTPAELEVALEIAKGHGTRYVADELGVTVFTVRTHLSRVLAKTGLRRQAELVRLLMSPLEPE